jgi:hypothetical protein
MEPNEAADQIREAAEAKEHSPAGNEKFRSRAAVFIAVRAMLLAITSLGGGNAAKEMTNNNIHASDTWSFYQAKNVRQTAYKLAVEGLETQLQIHQNALSPEARESIQKRIGDYRRTLARYEDEPDPEQPNDPLKGDGKKQLKARAIHFEEERDLAMRRDPNFDFAEALFQIAIVLGSVAILSLSRWILNLSLALGAVALVLMFNGFFLFLPLPF